MYEHRWEDSDTVGVVGIAESDQGLVVALSAPHGMDVSCVDVHKGSSELLRRGGGLGYVLPVSRGLVTVYKDRLDPEVVVSNSPFWDGHGCVGLVGWHRRIDMESLLAAV